MALKIATVTPAAASVVTVAADQFVTIRNLGSVPVAVGIGSVDSQNPALLVAGPGQVVATFIAAGESLYAQTDTESGEVLVEYEAEDSGGGSSSALTNWCRVEVDNGTPATVTVGAPEYDCVAADFRIPTQAGSDFTISDSLLQPGTGALYSAAGGKFEVAVRMTVPSNITLDGGSTATRYILVGLVGGNPHVFPNGDGIDYVMALDPTISSTPTEQKRMGPMQVAAGGEVFTNLQLALIAGTGTDQIADVQATVVEIYVWNL